MLASIFYKPCASMVYNADNMEWIEGGVLDTKHKPFNNIRYRTANSPTNNIAIITMLLATINNQLWRMDWGTIIWMDKHNNNIDTGGGRGWFSYGCIHCSSICVEVLAPKHTLKGIWMYISNVETQWMVWHWFVWSSIHVNKDGAIWEGTCWGYFLAANTHRRLIAIANPA